jgi:membrane protein
MRIIPRVALQSLRDFFRDGCVTYAASVAFFMVTAMVPFCLFLATVLGSILGKDANLLAFFTEKLAGLFPTVTEGITVELRKLITYKGIGTVSIIIYALFTFQLYSAIHHAMEAVFKVRDPRSIAGRLIFALVLMTLLVCLVLISFALTSSVEVLKATVPQMPWIEVSALVSFLLRIVVPFFLVQSAAVIIYMLVPKVPVRFRHAFWGGLFTAVMLEAAKYAFTWYMASVARLGTIYGSLTAFVLFLLWAFYASSILILGGELVHNLGNYGSPHPRRRATDF